MLRTLRNSLMLPQPALYHRMHLAGDARAEVGAKNSKGLTPLHVSCLKPNARMVSLLLLWGADTNARDRKKRTPDQIIGNSQRPSWLASFGVLHAVDRRIQQGVYISFEQTGVSVTQHDLGKLPLSRTILNCRDARTS